MTNHHVYFSYGYGARRDQHGLTHSYPTRRSSDRGLSGKFGRRLQARDAKTFGFDADFQVESYFRHQGISFVDRFDANSYLYFTRAMDYFDLGDQHGGRLADALRQSPVRFRLVSFDSDWIYLNADFRRKIGHAHA